MYFCVIIYKPPGMQISSSYNKYISNAAVFDLRFELVQKLLLFIILSSTTFLEICKNIEFGNLYFFIFFTKYRLITKINVLILNPH